MTDAPTPRPRSIVRIEPDERSFLRRRPERNEQRGVEHGPVPITKEPAV